MIIMIKLYVRKGWINMRLLVDTNVLLDVLCARKDFLEESAMIWKYCEVGKVDGYISALSIPNIVYILRKELTPEKTQKVIEKLFLIFKIVDLRASDLKKAASLKTNDYEDALQMVGASRIKADYIITRNIRDFAASSTPALMPKSLSEILATN